MRASRPSSRRFVPPIFVNLAPGRQRYTQFLNESGRHRRRPDGHASAGADGVLRLVVNASRKAVDFALIRERLPEGRAAHAARRGGADRPSGAAGRGDTGAPRARRGNSRPWPSWAPSPARIAEFETFVSRSGYTGEDGYEISLPAAQAEMFARLLLTQPDVAPIGLGARDSLAARGGPLPLWPRTRRDGRSGRGGARLVDPEAPARPRAAFPAPSAFRSALAKGPDAPARRPAPGRSRARARGGRDRVGRWRADRRRHVGRLRPERRRADRHGLRRARARRRRDAGRPRRARQSP